MELQYELPLLSTIAVGFSMAFFCGLVAVKLRLSPIVGYLLAGILVGPHTPGYLADVSLAEELSEIGVALLMFGVGLHFSFKDLLDVKAIAVPGAIVQILIVTALSAFIVNYCWDWPVYSGLVLGLALSVASTVVLMRALEDYNLLQSTNGRIAIGWLVVEDLVMVLALVLVPAMAGLKQGSGDLQTLAHDLAVAIGKVILFASFMLVAGKRLLPWLLTAVSSTRSRELFTLAVFAAALGVAFGAANFFGVSLALGAFFAGMMMGESEMSQMVASRALPLQDAFAVLFFVSVGMLFNPNILIEHPFQVLIVAGLIVIGKALVSGLIVWLFRYPLPTVLLASAGRAQIGEFSFVLANLGVAHMLLPIEGRDLILAGAMISIAVNPALFSIGRIVYRNLSNNPRYVKWIRRGQDKLAHLTAREKRVLKNLVILVGHGRVGFHVAEKLSAASVRLVVIDANRERISALRKHGYHAIAGDATDSETLKEAGLGDAVAIVIAVPNPFEARRIVDAARALKPSVRVAVRAHNDEEIDYFNKQQVDLAVMGAQEVAQRMVEFIDTLHPGHETNGAV